MGEYKTKDDKWIQSINDQPGRFLAVFFFAPILFIKGYRYHDMFIICFAIVLFVWDLYWLIYKKPRESSNN